MRGIETKICCIAAAALLCLSCSDWTKVEAYRPEDLTQNNKTEEYYSQIRKYRESDHQICFGYYSGWNGEDVVNMKLSLMGLPDSLDMVSLWGCWCNLNDSQKRDLKKAQELKGLKCLAVFIVASIGDQCTPAWISTTLSKEGSVEVNGVSYTDDTEARMAFWGLLPSRNYASIDEEQAAAIAAVEKYADAICDTIAKYNLDGFDFDYEYGYGGGYGNLVGERGSLSSANAYIYNDRSYAFVKRLRENLGPDKILMIDGAPESIDPRTGEFFDYFATQAYSTGSGSGSDAAMDQRFNASVKNFAKAGLSAEYIANRYLLLENFEQGLAATNGGDWRDRYGNTSMRSVEGMARWTPLVNNIPVRKGGFGAYHIEYGYEIPGESTTYPGIRQAIRIMNPPIL
ncbi:MAG: glycoside hydrolase family 18 [Candidatus Cryptobacteroides sp.]